MTANNTKTLYKVVEGNPLDLSEYFYYYRKLWKDVEPRYKANQYRSLAEKMAGIKRRQQFLAAKKAS